MEENPEIRQERRARRLLKKRERMQKHGKGIGILYRNAVMKRLRETKGK